MDAERPQERHRDLDRFLTFVDAVTAIAITLLVLPLAELGSELRDGTTVAPAATPSPSCSISARWCSARSASG